MFAWVEGFHFQRIIEWLLCSSRATYSRLPRTMSRWLLNVSKEGDSSGRGFLLWHTALLHLDPSLPPSLGWREPCRQTAYSHACHPAVLKDCLVWGRERGKKGRTEEVRNCFITTHSGGSLREEETLVESTHHRLVTPLTVYQLPGLISIPC